VADRASADRRRAGYLGNLGIQTKLALAFGVLLLLFAINWLLYAASLREVDRARSWADHTQAVLLALKDVSPPILRQQGAMRGFLVTFDPSFLDPYEEAGEQFRAALAKVRELTSEDAKQQAALDEVQGLAKQWWQFQQELQALAAEPGKQMVIQERLVSGRSTLMLNSLNEILVQMSARELVQLEDRNQRLDDGLERTRILSTAMMVIGAAFVLLALLVVSRHIGRPLSDLAALMGRLATGDTRVQVPNQRRGDEVGELARGLERFRIANEELATRAWTKARLAELSIALQTCESEQQFARVLLEHLVRALGAATGAVFTVQPDDNLELAGGHGVPEERYAARRLALGEGPVGQVAADGKPRTLERLPEGYFSVRTALGEARPRILYLLPLSGRERQVLGVIELALFETPEDHLRELIESATGTAGLVLESLSADLATRRLLETTQKQSEALRAQEEELRATNEILRDKQQQLEDHAQHLRASEEELRTQSEELRATNVQLEEKSLELERQSRELERASQYKSDFLANMSHELRTPLNSLLILAKGLADNESRNLDEEQLESARIIYDAGRSLLALINDILDLSKIEAGKMEAVSEEFELAGFAAGIERNFRAVARERKLEFSVQVAKDVPSAIRSDSAKLNQIVTNLLSNAFKFTHEGGVTLFVERPPAALAAAAGLAPEQAVAFRVRDSGIGIEPDKLARLFQAFEQGDTRTSRRYGGTGLGLSICRGLARLLGGDVSARSESGQGSEFSLVVPLNLVESAGRAGTRLSVSQPSLPPAPAEPPRNDSAAVLVVEDDVQFAEVLAGLVRGRGHRVLVARDGESALRMAADNPLAGVLLDIGLPGMDGWQVMEWFKNNPHTQNVPVHFISGADEHSRARAMGAAGYLRKPATQEQIAAVLDALPAPAARARRLLLIDDLAEERRLVRELLREQKVVIDECARAEEALEKMAVQHYDLLVLDLGLPGMDGFEFLEAASKRGPMPPVVIHSGRELTREESLKLREYTDSVILKSAPNTRRLLDEVTLFLHSIRRTGPSEPDGRRAVPHRLAGRTALIVDDDMRNMFALSKALRAQGLKVIMAQDGPKALAQLENSPEINIVLLDIMMPGMDGYEVLHRIRAEERWRTLPVIAVTAKAMSGDREKCLAAGASDYCPKPIDVDELVGQMAALLP
jgi:CheY-like chemotaxis protein/signal transduction histidine kinase/CHASE3 domain sensor protein